MYLNKLINYPIEERITKFAELIEHLKKDLKNEKFLNKFILIYPEWALEFQYVEELKKIITEAHVVTTEITKNVSNN